METTTTPMPRENLFRASFPACELRTDGDPASGPVLTGHFAVFNKWTEINSMWEGTFMERIAPGAFSKTFEENRDRMRVLFQHGQDPQIGDKPLGPIETLAETKTGAFYEVPLLTDTSYVRDLIPGLEAGLYGASFRFQVMREEVEEEPKPSVDNPRGLPERTIREAKVMEFGPVTFPAYAEATAGVRSITDEIMLGALAADPARFETLLTAARGANSGTSSSGAGSNITVTFSNGWNALDDKALAEHVRRELLKSTQRTTLSTTNREAAPDQARAANQAPGPVAPRTARAYDLDKTEEEPTWRL